MTTAAAAVLAPTWETLRPPARLALSEWADRFFYLSAESAAEPGRWRTLPYQKGIMDSITDPNVERVTFMKSARVGATKIMNAVCGYYAHQDPCPIMIVQPTVEDAQGYSKEEIAPMLRDCPEVGALFASKSRTSESTILAKSFPGGSLSMVGANSARGFRRVSRRVVLFDEVDGYPPSAGNEGDQIKLGIQRTQFYWNRKIVAASTPTIAGHSRIERLYAEGDQRRYYVPCPHCDHFDVLTFREDSDRGHFMRWPKDAPERAHFVCRACGEAIDERHKLAMLAAGEWRAAAEFKRHASFHIWAAYSVSPNSRWGQLATEFVEASKQSVEQLKTVVNTVLGEVWQDRGDAPEWSRLYERRERYPIGTVPDKRAAFLTAGVDVQRDRFVFEVVAWATNKESWSVDAGILFGDTAADETWSQLDELLGQTYPTAAEPLPIAMLAIDSGFNTQRVYNFARRYPMSRVIAVKGSATARVLVGTPSPVDVAIGGRARRRAYKVWPVGVDIAKAELYGFLRLPMADADADAPGYCHFPEHDPEFFRQLTAEHLVTTKTRNGFARHEWQIMPGRENHWLDARVYARVAASVLGIDRLVNRRPAARTGETPTPTKKRKRTGGSWLSKRRR